VAGKTNERRLVPVPRPEVADSATVDTFAVEANRREAGRDQIETPAIARRDRAAPDELPRERDRFVVRGVHNADLSLALRLCINLAATR
jgi:hypothetical protein